METHGIIIIKVIIFSFSCEPLIERLVPGGGSSKEPACQCRRHRRCGFDPGVGKILWRRAWQPTPVFLPGESHRQRSLVGCSPWGRNESDTTERLSTQHTFKWSFITVVLLSVLFSKPNLWEILFKTNKKNSHRLVLVSFSKACG